MNKAEYRAAFDSVKMSSECEERIFKQLEGPVQTKKRIGISRRFAPVIAAAVAVAVGGTAVSAAVQPDWFSQLFGKTEEIQYTEDIVAMTGAMENFEFDSKIPGFEISPVGAIFDERDMYCVMNAQMCPDCLLGGEIYNIYVNGEMFYGCVADDISLADDGSLIWRMNFDKPLFDDGDRVEINCEKCRTPDENGVSEGFDDIFTMSFDVSFGSVETVNVNYADEQEKYTAAYHTIGGGILNIFPLSVSLKYYDYTSADLMNNVTVETADGRTFEAEHLTSGYGICDGVFDGEAMWRFDDPVNVGDITRISMGNMLLYEK